MYTLSYFTKGTGRLLSIAALTLLGILLNACEDAPTKPKERGIHVNKIEIDTLYWGECVPVYGSGFGTEAWDLRIFLGSTPIPTILLSDSELTLCIPSNTESGTLRIYRGNTQAENRYLTIVERDLASLRPSISTFSPTSVYEDEPIEIRGVDLPLRRRDFRVRVGKVECAVDTFSQTSMVVRAPLGATTDSLIVEILSKSYYVGKLKMLAHNSSILQPGVIVKKVWVDYTLSGVVEWHDTDSNGTTVTTGSYNFTPGQNLKFPGDRVTKAHVIGDSVIYECSQTLDDSSTYFCEVRLLQNKARSRVSGWIRYRYTEPPGEPIRRWLVEFNVEDLIYKHPNSPQIAEHNVLGKEVNAIVKQFTWQQTSDEGGVIRHQKFVERIPSGAEERFWFQFEQ